MIAFTEREDSRRVTAGVNGETARLHFFGKGPEFDEVAARAAFIAMLPITWDGLALQNVELTPLGSSGNWDCVAEFSFSNEQLLGEFLIPDLGPNDPLGIEWGFDLTAATVHISQSLKTVRSVSAKGADRQTFTWEPFTEYATNDQVLANGNVYICSTGGVSATTGTGPSGTGAGIDDGTCVWTYIGPDTPIDPKAPDYHGAIGATIDRITGTDVFAGHLELTLTRQVYPVTQTLLEQLLDSVGTTNESEYKNYEAGTLLYLGCTGTCKPGNIWTLCHKFACSPTLTNIPVGPDIIIPEKKGWDYLWCTYGPEQVGDYLLQVPKAAYVEQVYRTTDFSALPA